MSSKPEPMDLFDNIPENMPAEIYASENPDEQVEYHSRSPTCPPYPEIQGPDNRKEFDLNESQKRMASALLRKSRELVSKSKINIQASIQEEP